jgi:cytochrome c oxidase cbb3-type subunit 3
MSNASNARDSGRRAMKLALGLMSIAIGLSEPTARPQPSSYANQDEKAKNAGAGDPAAILEGRSIFRANCALCHGVAAQGGFKGPDLTSGQWTHGGSDTAISRTITRGVPGTDMPANSLAPDETWKVIAYLRSLAAGHDGQPVAGSSQLGARLFFGKALCSKCHMVRGRGGRLGPDLSRIGASRSAHFLTDKVRNPDTANQDQTVDLWWEMGLSPPYQTVTVVTRDGQQITGALRNEDTFSIQLMDPDEQLRLFLKKDLRQVDHTRESLMPAFGEGMISREELWDLLAYLSSLRM